jgi:hypothetical protein
VEAACRRHGLTPAAILGPSRDAYAWLRFIHEPNHLRDHLAAVARGVAALKARPGFSGARLELKCQAATWRWREGGRVLNVSEGLLHADHATWDALAQAATTRGDQVARDAVRRWMDGEACRQVLAALGEPVRDQQGDGKGRHHDLARSFARVNRDWFDGALAIPILAWSRAPTFQRLGSYDRVRDRLTVSRSLDAAQVPDWVVDYIMFHELLHKHLGFEDRGLTRGVHTAAFREAEAVFPRREEAERFLEGLAQQVRRARRR